ncbi:secreted protein [Candidatus Magnetobacterium bavaricum]|uniref:Alpha-amylase n=1 Tax=Candidatus Magnetobacterium bavaricum TaxID=29290 RepID=A0A0F3GKN1_9BACT|nr:secreted protein [Candidatus Magnetobacterium bavaricum]
MFSLKEPKKGLFGHSLRSGGQVLRRLFVLSFFFVYLLLSSYSHADVILHAFNWKYSTVKDRAREIAELGYKKVLVAPPMLTRGDEWYQRYQPMDYRVIDGPLGNKEDFVTMINELGKYKVVVYADIILNHMANRDWYQYDQNYPGDKILEEYRNKKDYFDKQKLFGDLNNNLFSSSDFHQPGKCIGDYNNIGDVQYNRLCGGGKDRGLPDINPTNWVVEQHRNYLFALKDLGVKGFRIDAAKHMTNYQITKIFAADVVSGTQTFGEIITGGGAGTDEYTYFLEPFLRTTGLGAYDFPLFASIRRAFQPDGTLSSLVDPLTYGQALATDKAITFAITHDIPNNDGFRYQIMPTQDEHMAYAYILGRDGGVPMVYTDNNESNKDNSRWVDAYKRPDIKNMISFHNSMQGYAMEVIGHGKCYIIFRRYDQSGTTKGIVGINKCETDQDYNVNSDRYHLVKGKNYRNVFDKKAVSVNDNPSFRMPKRQAKLWILD